MKPTEFAKYLTEFLTTYLTGQKNVSKNTILSYRDTFKLLLKYCQSMKRIPPERITMETLTSELVTGFLDWLETERKCGISTRNQRLAESILFPLRTRRRPIRPLLFPEGPVNPDQE